MSGRLKTFPELKGEQSQASDPRVHAALSASAGTGKTQVLTARVLRLLLQRARPESILCLTFTKAAAAEMANRIGSRLAAWVRLKDTELGNDLMHLGEINNPRMRERARQLFARVLDCPGGLKIQTIHAFSQSLLAAFPAEAGIVPGFQPLEGRAEQELVRRTLADLLADAESKGDQRRAALLESLDELLHGGNLESISIADISRRAGVTRSAFYFYFENKAVAVAALMEEMYAESFAAADLLTGDGALQWLGGVYYYKEGYDQPVFTTLFDQPQLDGPITPAVRAITCPGAAATAPCTAALDFERRLYDDRPTFEDESYAAYGQIDWQFTPTLKATVGLRYSHDKKTGTEAVRILCFATTTCGTTPELLGSFTPPGIGKADIDMRTGEVDERPAVAPQADHPEGEEHAGAAREGRCGHCARNRRRDCRFPPRRRAAARNRCRARDPPHTASREYCGHRRKSAAACRATDERCTAGSVFRENDTARNCSNNCWS